MQTCTGAPRDKIKQNEMKHEEELWRGCSLQLHLWNTLFHLVKEASDQICARLGNVADFFCFLVNLS